MVAIKLIKNIALISGIGLFVTNTLDSGKDERLLSGCGSALVIIYFSINEYWTKKDLNIKLPWKILATLLSVIGVFTFVVNSLDSGEDERILAGIGASMFVAGLAIRELFGEATNGNSNIRLDSKTIGILAFIICFTFLGLYKNKIQRVERNQYGIEDDIKELDEKVEDLERYSHGHN